MIDDIIELILLYGTRLFTRDTIDKLKEIEYFSCVIKSQEFKTRYAKNMINRHLCNARYTLLHHYYTRSKMLQRNPNLIRFGPSNPFYKAQFKTLQFGRDIIKYIHYVPYEELGSLDCSNRTLENKNGTCPVKFIGISFSIEVILHDKKQLLYVIPRHSKADLLYSIFIRGKNISRFEIITNGKVLYKKHFLAGNVCCSFIPFPKGLNLTLWSAVYFKFYDRSGRSLEWLRKCTRDKQNNVLDELCSPSRDDIEIDSVFFRQYMFPCHTRIALGKNYNDDFIFYHKNKLYTRIHYNHGQLDIS
jgi:hypothetical protein